MNTGPYIKHTPDGQVYFGIDPAANEWSRFQSHAAAKAWMQQRLATTNSTQYVADANGKYTFSSPVHSSEIVELASSILAMNLTRGQPFTNPQCARDFAQLKLGNLQHEVFAVLFLDTRHCLIAFEKLFRGTINTTNVYPREVVKRTLEYNTAAVIFTHNHPSGVTDPSPADQAITCRLKGALALIDVRVLDHIIVSATETTSMADRGLI